MVLSNRIKNNVAQLDLNIHHFTSEKFELFCVYSIKINKLLIINYVNLLIHNYGLLCVC